MERRPVQDPHGRFLSAAGLVRDGPTSFGLAGARGRVLPRHSLKEGARFVLQSLAVGAGVGVVNLAANWWITATDPTLRALLVERMRAMDPWEALVTAPILEEVVFRLFVMSVVAWVVYRLTKRPRLAYLVALLGSGAIFAVPHLVRPLPTDLATANFYRGALMAKYTLLGVPFGWVFWRRGLPYAILCHSAANATHIVLQWRVF